MVLLIMKPHPLLPHSQGLDLGLHLLDALGPGLLQGPLNESNTGELARAVPLGDTLHRRRRAFQRREASIDPDPGALVGRKWSRVATEMSFLESATLAAERVAGNRGW